MLETEKKIILIYLRMMIGVCFYIGSNWNVRSKKYGAVLRNRNLKGILEYMYVTSKYMNFRWDDDNDMT